MLGLVNVKYRSLPINLLYNEASGTASPIELLNLADGSMGMLVGLQANIPASDRSSRVYFLCHNEIPLVVLATLRPRKNFKVPKYLSLNLLSRNCLNTFTSSTSLLAIRISST